MAHHKKTQPGNLRGIIEKARRLLFLEVVKMGKARFTICAVLVILFTFTAISRADYSGGLGTAAEPYEIDTVADWQALMDTPTDWDKHFILTADIDVNGVPLSPVGNDANNFTGVFDGNDHIIRNADMNMPDTDYVGLFGYVDPNGQIRNLGVEDVMMAGRALVGSLVGRNKGNLSACHATGNVEGDNTVGGLVGFNDASVTECWASSDVNVIDGWIGLGGGLVGYNRGNLNACYALGSVRGNEVVGGLVGGHGSGDITACYAIADVSGDNRVGGLIGDSRSSIMACYSAGLVSGAWDVGGLVGWNSFGMPIACFWDVETSGQPTSVGGRGLATSQMKSVAIYRDAGWAGQGWVIEDGLDYPRLEWEGSAGVPIPDSEPPPFLGDGTAEDPYQIWTAEDFAFLGEHVSIVDKHIVLMTDVDLSEITLHPIGGLAPFVGIFDGNDHVIRSPDVNMPASDYVGLFGCVGAKGEVRNLRAEDAAIRARSFVGALVGYNLGTLSNCSVTGSVNGHSTVGGMIGRNEKALNDFGTDVTVSGNSAVGGLIGRNYGDLNNCYANGAVRIYGDWGGGFAGDNHGDLTDCYASGSVWGSITYIGGFVGRNKGNLDSCYATGSVEGDQDVGGLVGYNDYASITSSYARGLVSGRYNVGGLVGYCYRGSLTDCYATRKVVGSGGRIGGLAGETYSSEITACYATGSASGFQWVGGLVGKDRSGNTTACYATGSVSGNTGVGGLVGENQSSLTMCCSAGNVIGVDGSGKSYDIGGFVGMNYRGTITACYTTGSVQGYNWVGGLVGRNHSSSVNSSYAAGHVSGSTNVGGLVGENWYTCTVDACFWDMDTSGLGGSAGGEGKTTGEMQDANTFITAGWDIVGESVNGTEDIWSICEGTNYPRFVWQIPAADWVCPAGVGLEDFGYFGGYWGTGEAGPVNLDGEDGIGFGDLMIFCEQWLVGR